MFACLRRACIYDFMQRHSLGLARSLSLKFTYIYKSTHSDIDVSGGVLKTSYLSITHYSDSWFASSHSSSRTFPLCFISTHSLCTLPRYTPPHTHTHTLHHLTPQHTPKNKKQTVMYMEARGSHSKCWNILGARSGTLCFICIRFPGGLSKSANVTGRIHQILKVYSMALIGLPMGC